MMMLCPSTDLLYSRPDPCPGVEYTFGVMVSKGAQGALENGAELRFDETACTISTFGTKLPHVVVSPKVRPCILATFIRFLGPK